MDPQTALYLQYYRDQAGGNLPAFSGARRGQYGAGLGDILRGIFRTILPIAIRGAASFLGATLQSRDSGSSWRNAAMSALPGTAQTIANEAVEKLKNVTAKQQEGGGRRKGRRRRRRESVQRSERYKRTRSESGGPSSKRIKFINF